MSDCSNGFNKPDGKAEFDFELPIEPGFRDSPPSGTWEDGYRLSLEALKLVEHRPEIFARRLAQRCDVEFKM